MALYVMFPSFKALEITIAALLTLIPPLNRTAFHMPLLQF